MNDQDPVVGIERADAIANLRSSLSLTLGNLAAERFQGDLFAEAQYQDIYDKLFSPIVLEEGAFEKNIYTPTPGDPMNVVMANGASYISAAHDYMLGKLDTTATQVGVNTSETVDRKEGLTIHDYTSIKHEIEFQHQVQVSKNQASFDNLKNAFIANPASTNPWMAAFIKLGRSVDADTVSRLAIIDSYTEMDSIEDLKITCTLDVEAYQEAIKFYKNNLNGLRERSNGRFTATLTPRKLLKPRPRNLKDSASKEVVAAKTVIAEIVDSVSGQVFEAVEKLNEYEFPEDRELYNITPNIIDGKNRQPVYLQIYLRVKRDRTEDEKDEEETMSETRYNAQQLVIIKAKERISIDDLTGGSIL